MNSHVEDFNSWKTEALVTVPPETLEYSDLVGLVIELQQRLLGKSREQFQRPYYAKQK